MSIFQPAIELSTGGYWPNPERMSDNSVNQPDFLNSWVVQVTTSLTPTAPAEVALTCFLSLKARYHHQKLKVIPLTIDSPSKNGTTIVR